MENQPEIQNAHILLGALNKIKQQIQPAEKGEATFYWTTLKFQESIYEITQHKFSFDEISNALKQDLFIDDYIQGVGIVWLVKDANA